MENYGKLETLLEMVHENKVDIEVYNNLHKLVTNDALGVDLFQQCEVTGFEIEDGTVTFIGATTENPFFEVNAPLRSPIRCFTAVVHHMPMRVR